MLASVLFCFSSTWAAETDFLPEILANIATKEKQSLGVACTSPVLRGNQTLHVTWFHLHTQDKKIIERAQDIFTDFYTKHAKKSGNHYVVSWDHNKRKMWGKNSLLLTGEVETFKHNLDKKLRQDKEIAKYLSPYRNAHIDLQGKSKDLPFFKEFRVSDFRIVRTKNRQNLHNWFYEL